MLITQIEKVSNSKYNIYLDEEYAFLLYGGDIYRYQLAEGQEFPLEIYHKLTQEILPKRAISRCMHLLEHRDYTERELREKLERGGYPRESTDQAIDYVSSYGYLNDTRYAARYIDTYGDRKSRRLIEQELLRKGISRDILAASWPEEDSRIRRIREDDMIRQLLAKKHFDPQTADEKERRRLYAMLLRKGFEASAIAEALF
jgi:regulatory protein